MKHQNRRIMNTLTNLRHHPGKAKATRLMEHLDSIGLIEWSALGWVVSAQGIQWMKEYIEAEQAEIARMF